jgi:hypothetical protein
MASGSSAGHLVIDRARDLLADQFLQFGPESICLPLTQLADT